MDELEEVWSGLVAFTTRYGLLSVAAIQFLKSAGVPLPVPSGLFTVPLGVQARQGTRSLWLAWSALTLASVTNTGASLLSGFLFGPRFRLRKASNPDRASLIQRASSRRRESDHFWRSRESRALVVARCASR